MKQILLGLCAIFLFAVNTEAQISRGGEPVNWGDKSFDTSSLEWINTGSIDLELLQSQDAVTDQYKEAPYRFGEEFEVNIDVTTAGTWSNVDNGRILRLGIECREAVSINLFFDQYNLPKGSELFIWTADRDQFLGSFNHLNNKESNTLATTLLDSDRIVIEYFEPTYAAGEGVLHLSQIIHGYRSVLPRYEEAVLGVERGPYGNSGACNINVNCEEGFEWQVEKRSVCLIIQGGNAVCTGALINNTNCDLTPYFLTANHCLGNPANWVYVFNHEAADCDGDTGPVSQTVDGGTLIASNSGSDFALVELSETPPDSYNPQWAGWNATDLESEVSLAVGIHHPSGDVKKICFEDDAPYHDNAAGAQVWWIDQWELGVTEPGSSGSPLFDQNHRIIGQLYGGAAACNGNSNNGQFDYYGRIGVSWDGPNPSSRLKDWLDPTDSGVLVIDGCPDGFELFANDAGMGAISGIEGTLCGDEAYPVLTILNQGSTTLTSAVITYSYNGGPDFTVNWSGSLETFESDQVGIGPIPLVNGDNTITASVSDPNATEDENDNNNQTQFDFQAATGDTFWFTINILTDDYPEETSWEITDGGTVLYASESFSDQGTLYIEEICLPEGCYDFTILDSFGDGLCCGFGEGNYEVHNQNGVAVASGGEFQAEETTEICADANSIEELEKFGLNVFPNPNKGEFTIVWDRDFAPTSVTIHSILGELVMQENTSSAKNTFKVNTDLASGIYILSMTDGTQLVNKKIEVK